jgi:hypothetical protein
MGDGIPFANTQLPIRYEAVVLHSGHCRNREGLTCAFALRTPAEDCALRWPSGSPAQSDLQSYLVSCSDIELPPLKVRDVLLSWSQSGSGGPTLHIQAQGLSRTSERDLPDAATGAAKDMSRNWTGMSENQWPPKRTCRDIGGEVIPVLLDGRHAPLFGNTGETA